MSRSDLVVIRGFDQISTPLPSVMLSRLGPRLHLLHAFIIMDLIHHG